MHVGYGFTEQEIAMKLGMKNLLFIQRKTRAFLKMNPNYKPMKQNPFLREKDGKRNHQLGLVI